MNDLKEERKLNRSPGLTIQQMSARICRREDNLYFKQDCILDIIRMYLDECANALNDGEKINLSKLGTLTPSVHTPLHRCNLYCSREDRSDSPAPYTRVNYTRNSALQLRMNTRFKKNIKDGYAGLGSKCECSTSQIRILQHHGLLKADEALVEEEENVDYSIEELNEIDEGAEE